MVGANDRRARILSAGSVVDYFAMLGMCTLLAGDLVVLSSGASLLGTLVNCLFAGCLMAYRNGSAGPEFVRTMSYAGFGTVAFRIWLSLTYGRLSVSPHMGEMFSLLITTAWAIAMVFTSMNSFFAEPPPRDVRHVAAA